MTGGQMAPTTPYGRDPDAAGMGYRALRWLKSFHPPLDNPRPQHIQ